MVTDGVMPESKENLPQLEENRPVSQAVPATRLNVPSPGYEPRKLARLLVDALLIALVPVVLTVGFGIYQSVRPQKIVSPRTPADFGLDYEDATLRTADGLALAAWYVPSKVPTDAAVLVLHGYPADKGDILPRAAFLAERHNLLLLDFRYFGKSEGSFTSAGAKEVEDALAGIAYLKAKGNGRIGIYGFSMGGAVALMALDRTTDVLAVVAEAPYANLQLISEEPYRYLGPLRKACAWLTAKAAKTFLRVDVDAASPERVAAKTRVPVLLIHSREDKVIPFRHAEILQDALKANPSAEFLFPDGQAHGDPSEELAKSMAEFYAKHLP
jgi:dipeptidyl aminopeptidase/acylaminoacyl peptidase